MRADFSDNLIKYKETPVFNEHNVPTTLLKSHNTKRGIWVKLIVWDGAVDLAFEIGEREIVTVNAGDNVIIEPQVPHHLKITGKVNLYLEFYRAKEMDIS